MIFCFVDVSVYVNLDVEDVLFMDEEEVIDVKGSVKKFMVFKEVSVCLQ